LSLTLDLPATPTQFERGADGLPVLSARVNR
jgi:hypothetical protein